MPPRDLPNYFDLRGKVAIVTGGSRGLGRAMALALGRAGAKVIITARRRAALDTVVEEMRGLGIEATGFCCDIGIVSLVPKLVDDLLACFGDIDILVNNAGQIWNAPAQDHPSDAWSKVIDVNLNGTWALTQGVAAKSMLPRKMGSIIIIASAAGLPGNVPQVVPSVAYNASKAALINLSKSLAAEWGPFGVRVNALVPGWFTTRMSSAVLERHGEAISHRIPMMRFGSDEDIVGPMLFLASDASCYVTGQALGVDGGLSAALI